MLWTSVTSVAKKTSQARSISLESSHPQGYVYVIPVLDY